MAKQIIALHDYVNRNLRLSHFAIIQYGLNMQFRERLALAREALKISQGRLGKEIGAAQSTVASWENGKNEPNLTTICRIAKTLNRTPEWLAFGSNADVSSDMVYLPEYDVRALSGSGGLLEIDEQTKTEKTLHRYAFPATEIRTLFGTSPDGIVVFEVIGDSMAPTLNPGEKVFVNTSDIFPTPPGIFVVWDGMGLVLKRIEYIAHTSPPKVRIISDNKAYMPYERSLDEAYIQGRVVGSWQRR